jgi:thiol:disulfide interchange protein
MTVTVIRHIAAALLFGLFSLRALAVEAPAAPAAAPQGLAAALAKSGGDDFLQPDQAFRLDAVPEGSDRVRLNFQIAEGYYLYRARIKAATTSSNTKRSELFLSTLIKNPRPPKYNLEWELRSNEPPPAKPEQTQSTVGSKHYESIKQDCTEAKSWSLKHGLHGR